MGEITGESLRLRGKIRGIYYSILRGHSERQIIISERKQNLKNVSLKNEVIIIPI